MSISTAHERHRGHHTIRLRSILLVIATVLLGCGVSLRRPPVAALEVTDFFPVPFPPRAPPVEFVPPSPSSDAVWIDGSWVWSAERFSWRPGTWVVPPKGVRYASWAVVRRKEDGQLFFASSSWKDASGKKVDDRAWIQALGPRARARSRLPSTSDEPGQDFPSGGRPGGPGGPGGPDEEGD